MIFFHFNPAFLHEMPLSWNELYVYSCKIEEKKCFLYMNVKPETDHKIV